MNERPMIEAEGLRKVYGEKVAVDRVDLEVPAGRILGVLGPNGAGKSTTVRMLTTMTSPDAGTGRVAGVIERPTEESEADGPHRLQTCGAGQLLERGAAGLVGDHTDPAGHEGERSGLAGEVGILLQRIEPRAPAVGLGRLAGEAAAKLVGDRR